MQFHAEFTPQPFSYRIKHTDKLLLLGSCFTEQIGAKLAKAKFKVLDNPNGILFNPISICQAMYSYCKGYEYTEDDLFYFNELWGSWKHHTRFSGIDKMKTLEGLNASQKEASNYVKTADWIMLTLGSAFVYEKTETNGPGYENVVANCHKVPNDKFNRRLLNPSEIIEQLKTMMEAVWEINPGAKFMYTISPVRHLREGFIENNRSKAALIQAVHHLTSENVFYFPSYELIIDDLRDYRFYAEDMVHPNYAATNYVWGKFVEACIDKPSQQLMEEINALNAARNHKAFNPQSEAHKKFLKTNLEKIVQLKSRCPYLNFEEEEKYFS